MSIVGRRKLQEKDVVDGLCREILTGKCYYLSSLCHRCFRTMITSFVTPVSAEGAGRGLAVIDEL